MIRLALVAIGLLFATMASAHRGHDAMTTVTVMADGEVRVSLRFAAHDIEPALADIAPDAQANLDDPVAISAFVNYLRRTFSLASERGPILLSPGPIDVDSDEVQIGFVGKARGPIRQLTIMTKVLTDIYPQQINQVNVRVGDVVQTLTFTSGDTKTINLKQRR